MNLDIVDYLIGGAILSVILIYALLRYKEERKKEKINYIPMLLSYLEKYDKEKEEFQKRADDFKEKLQDAKEKIEKLKRQIKEYKWKKSDIEKVKRLKGTEFETYFSGLFEIMGYKITEPPIYKDKNIDFILQLEKANICIDFIDYTKIKKLDDKYINILLEGKKKYKCKSLWIITNTEIDNNLMEKFIKNDINVISLNEILFIFPSIRLFDNYFDAKTVYHNYELLYKETYDEIIRRNTWINEIKEKLSKEQLKNV